MSNHGFNNTFNMFGFGTSLHAATTRIFNETISLSAEDCVSLVKALKDKLRLLSGQNLDYKVRKRVEFLRDLQRQHDELEEAELGERALLQAKYQRLYEPLYTKRYEIVNGMVEVEGVTEEVKSKKQGTQEKGIPDFWLTVMNANAMLAEEITERDKGALKYLQDIKCCRLDNPKGFKLEFYFDTNPYFKNSVLTKTYLLDDDDHDDILLEKAIGTEIKWNPGKCLTQKVLRKKPKNGSKNYKPITKTENCTSFFNFFNPPQIPEDDESLDDDAAEDLQYLMEKDYDMGSTIGDKIIPHAVSWYTGEAVETEQEGIEEDEEEEEEREGKTWKKKSGRAQSRKGHQAEYPICCTQQ